MKAKSHRHAHLFGAKLAAAIRRQPGYRRDLPLLVSHAKGDPPDTWRLYTDINGRWMDASLSPQPKV